MIRPQAARWFELVVAHGDAFLALEAQAMTGAVEIEWHRVEAGAGTGAGVNRLLREYGALSRCFRPYWPAARLRGTARVAPAEALARGIEAIGVWAIEAEPVIARLQDAETEIAQLGTVARLMREVRGAPIDFSAIGRPGSRLTGCVFVYPKGARLALPSSLLLHPFDIGEETFLLAVGAPEMIEPLAQEVTAANGRRVRVPEWLRPDAEENLALIAKRQVERESDAATARAALAALHQRHDLALALGDIARASWCYENMGAIGSGGVFSRITGWTSDAAKLTAAVEASEARALAGFPSPPRGARPPLLLRNPWWAKPFEVFSQLFGMPGQHGADPTVLLALAVPLLFGYMFGDLGQGLLVAAIGFALRGRMPVLRVLVPAGLSAAVFGLLFGSVFSLEHLILPLWLNPLERPLTVLWVSLAAGVALLGIGLALNALGAYWSGGLREWLALDLGFVAVYFGILGGFFHPAGFGIALAGAAAVALGHAWVHRDPAAALKGIAELLERTMQILINTLSFARVGAFALAHAGLSSAVVALAHAAGGGMGFVLVMIVGNAVIVGLEGLVVSVQTTRLILFEFFARFFQAQGREFRPLLPPPLALEEK